MKRIYIFRQIWSKKLFSLLKSGSLLIGFTVFTILLSLVRNELDYDKFWQNRKSLYRVAMEQYQGEELSFRSAKSYRGLPAILMEELPEVEEMTRLHKDVITVFVGEEQIQDVSMFWADTNVFKVLPREILARESERIFMDIHSMAISESLALKLYGTVDCLGEPLRLNEGWTFYISAVFESVPENSHIQFDLLADRASVIYYMRNFDNTTGQLVDDLDFEFSDPGPYHRASWNNRLADSYLIIKEGTDMELLQQKANELISEVELPDRFSSNTIQPIFQRIDDIHLRSGLPNDSDTNGSVFYVYMLVLIAIVVIVMSWINFINLFSIVFHETRQETAIRTINGADRSVIQWEIFAKALVLSLVSGLFSLALMKLFHLLIPAFSIRFSELAILLALSLISAFLSTLIPMISFHTSKTISYLKGEVFGNARNSWYRLVTVGIQFTASVILIASTIVILFQMNYLQKKDLEFEPGDVIYSFSPMTMNQRPDIPQKLIMFRNEVAQIPAIEQFCVSSSVPGRPLLIPSFTIRHQVGEIEREVLMERVNVDPYFFDLYEIMPVAGALFMQNPQYDTPEVVLNRKAVEELGYMEPSLAVGKTLVLGERHYQILGVVENYHHLSLKNPIQPLVFFKSLRWRNAVGFYSFRINSFSTATIKRIADIWSEVYPGEHFLYQPLIDTYMDQYENESRFSKSFLIAAILAILISCLGLVGLSKYLVLKRTREIGIRKAFGYSAIRIMGLLQKESLRLVLLASFVGIPVAWLIIQRWLENFAYRINPAWWMFASAVIIVYFIVFAITFFHTWNASRRNPVEALRYE